MYEVSHDKGRKEREALKKVVILISIILSLHMIAGCAAEDREMVQGYTQTNGVYEPGPYRGMPVLIPNSNTGQGTNTRTDNITYHETYEGQTVEELLHEVGKLDGVDDVSIVIHERTVLVGIKTEEQKQQERIKQEAKQVIKQKLGKQDIRIVFDNASFEKLQKLDSELRHGAPFTEVGPRHQQFLRDFGRILQQPFEKAKKIE